MASLPLKTRVRVPATSANLGPGFDALGLALQIYNFVSVEESPSDADEIIAIGEGAHALQSGDPQKNIALCAVQQLWRELDLPLTPFKLTLENAIPLARGLGSSSAARVGALVAANHLAENRYGKSAEEGTLLSLATRLEGHPDNVVPALLGGLIVSITGEGGEVIATRAPIRKFPRLVVFIPQNELETKAARGVLPTEVPMQDAIFNIGRTSFLVVALVNREWEFLGEALRDKLHQNQRAALMPAYESVVRAAKAAGAFGATLSGAGPGVLAWLPDESSLVADAITEMQNAAIERGVLGAAREIEVDLEGCVIDDSTPLAF